MVEILVDVEMPVTMVVVATVVIPGDVVVLKIVVEI